VRPSLDISVRLSMASSLLGFIACVIACSTPRRLRHSRCLHPLGLFGATPAGAGEREREDEASGSACLLACSWLSP